MAVPPLNELPEHAMVAASFAESLAVECARRGRPTSELFAAFVGLVSARDRTLAATCLNALDIASRHADEEGASPSV
jgi:hypothetical protein